MKLVRLDCHPLGIPVTVKYILTVVAERGYLYLHFIMLSVVAERGKTENKRKWQRKRKIKNDLRHPN